MQGDEFGVSRRPIGNGVDEFLPDRLVTNVGQCGDVLAFALQTPLVEGQDFASMEVGVRIQCGVVVQQKQCGRASQAVE